MRTKNLLRQLANLTRIMKNVYAVPLEEAQYLALGYYYIFRKTDFNNLLLKEELHEIIRKEELEKGKNIVELFLEEFWEDVVADLNEEEQRLLHCLQEDKKRSTLEKLLKRYSSDNIYFVSELLHSLETKGLVHVEQELWYTELNKHIYLLPLGRAVLRKLKGSHGAA
ncbi:MAG: hypothetical protein GXO42_01040 [bacterium]|nr:hypothetical protein [bacterium]